MSVTHLRPQRVADQPRLTVVKRRSRRLIKRDGSTRFAPLLVAMTIFVGAVIFAVLLEQVILAQSAFKLASMRTEIATAEAERQELLLEVTKLQSPARVERFARQVLGMVEPATLQYVVADIAPPGTRGKQRPGRERAEGPNLAGAAP